MANETAKVTPKPGYLEDKQPASLLDRIVEQQAESASRYKPVMSIQELIERERAVQYLVDHIMVDGVDYGWIPGTQPKEASRPGEYRAKPTLFKAGAERACAFFGYAPRYVAQEVIEKWTVEDYGEPLFYYRYECTLRKDGHEVGAGIGSGSTWESKYRYRRGERECPECGRSGSIVKGRKEYGGGWLCFQKKGGCGAKFHEGDDRIEAQATDQVANPDIADVINTVQKMAQKRAYVAATLTATGLSGRFTQDLEDLPAPPAPRQQQAEAQPQTPLPSPPEPPTKQPDPPKKGASGGKHNLTMAYRIAEFQRQKKRVGERPYYNVLARHGYEHANEICKATIEIQRAVFRELVPLPDDDADTAQEPPEPPQEPAVEAK